MKFKIRKEVSTTGTWYWTVPSNIFLRMWHCFPLVQDFLYDGTEKPYGVWLTKNKAIQHIKRWNSGYYKKRYYKKDIEVER